MTEIIRRNDPCPCGSGKKYKRCCLEGESAAQLGKVRMERYFQQKQQLTERLISFMESKLSFNEYHRLLGLFRTRSERVLSEEKHEVEVFRFWLYYFHRFENGLRGIEWFYQERGRSLSEPELDIVKRWAGLAPKLVQASNHTEASVEFQEVETGDVFLMEYPNDNLPYFAPWYGTLGLVELVEDRHYFLGVRLFEGPREIEAVRMKALALSEESERSLEDVYVDYFPELVSVLIGSKGVLNEEEAEEKVVSQFTFEAKVADEEAVANYFYRDDRFVVDAWTQTKKELSWVEGWRAYSDSVIEEEIILADAHGRMAISDGRMEFTCVSEERAKLFEGKLKGIEAYLSHVTQTEETMTVPFYADLKSTFIKSHPSIPAYMGLYANVSEFVDVQAPIPLYDNLSLQELIEKDRVCEAETWLKQTEYHTYMQAHEKHDGVAATADLNTVRKKLGLPLSPFVTGGADRRSDMREIERPDDKPFVVQQSEIALYEELGFTPDTINRFYTADLLSFYHERTAGRSENTIRKYKTNLHDIRAALEKANDSSWHEYGESFWRDLITEEFFKMNEAVSKTHLKDFLSTVKLFAAWLDQNKGMDVSKCVQQVISESDELLQKKMAAQLVEV